MIDAPNQQAQQTERPAPRIVELYAFVAPTADGTEGVLATTFQGAWMPLIARDASRVERMIPSAQDIANQLGVRFRILRFTDREDVTDRF